jgi:hypothetical protein
MASRSASVVACRSKPGIVGCGQLITFDRNRRGKYGGWIPLEEVTDVLGQTTLQMHQCPNKPVYNATTMTTTTTNNDEEKKKKSQTVTTEQSSEQTQTITSVQTTATTLSNDHLLATVAEMVSILNTRMIDKLTTTVDELKAEVKSKRK